MERRLEGRKYIIDRDVEWQKNQYKRNNIFIEDIEIEQNYTKLMQMLSEYEKEQKKQEDSLSKYMYSAQKSDWIIQRNKRNVQKIKTKSQVTKLCPLDYNSNEMKSNLTYFQQEQMKKKKNSGEQINFIKKNINKKSSALNTSNQKPSDQITTPKGTTSPIRRQNSHHGTKETDLVPQNLSLEWEITRNNPPTTTNNNNNHSKQLYNKSRTKKRPLLSIAPLPKNDARLSCKSFVVYKSPSDQSGKEERIAGRKDNQQFEIASLTKTMTLWVSLNILQESLHKDPNDIYIRVSQKASSIKGTSAQLKEGDILTCYELFYGLMLPSGNDAAWALAEAFGSLLSCPQPEQQRRANEIIDPESTGIKQPERPFLQEMNKYCQKLSLDDTQYANPHGLGNRDNLSTASDQAKLAAIVMQHKTVREVVKTKQYSLKVFNDLNDQMTRQTTWNNTNKLLTDNCRINGLKTGITNSAGGCLASTYSLPVPHYQSIFDQKVYHHYYIVTLGSLDTAHRFIDTQKIINKFILPPNSTCDNCTNPSCTNNNFTNLYDPNHINSISSNNNKNN